MRTSGSWTPSVVCVAVGLAASTLAAGPQSPAIDLPTVLARVGERVADYYRRAQSIVCTEKVLAQPINSSFSPQGFARALEYELHIESEEAEVDGLIHAAKMMRELRKVNGHVPKASELEGCFDPESRQEEPLEFLLPKNQSDYQFKKLVAGKGKDREALVIEFVHEEKGEPEFHHDEKKGPDCMSFTLPFTTKGRVLVDPSTFDVLRVEEELAHHVDVRVPYQVQRNFPNMPDYITIDRHTTTTRYAVVKFKDPEEALLLPTSIDQLTVGVGGVSHRNTQQFTDYRRFLTAGRIVK